MLAHFLNYQYDVWIFCALCVSLMFLSHFWIQQVYRVKGMPLVSWAFLFLILFTAVSWANQIGNNAQNNLKKMISGFAPTYAIEMSKNGHWKLPSDMQSDDPLYLKLIDAEIQWLKVNPFLTDIYTIRKDDKGRFILWVDSETDYNRDGVYSGDREVRTAIGEIYSNETANPYIYDAFLGVTTFIEKPYTDKWGTWVSAFSPITNDKGEVEAILGLDYAADDWLTTIFWQRASALGFMTVAVIILIAMMFIMASSHAQEQQRRIAEDKFKEAVQMKYEFVSTVSHELRTPLTVIKEGIGIVEDGSAGALNDEQRDFLLTAKNNVDRLARLINNVLDFQKLDSRNNDFALFENDLVHIVKDACRDYLLVAKSKGLNLECHASGSMIVQMDKDRITQVLSNLLSNAIKFSAQGTIGVSVKKEKDGFVRVEIRDEGSGIQSEDIPKLFKSFSQGQTNVGRKTGGSGLGLAISKKIIEAHGGSIGVESVYGKGSTFYFNLPSNI